MTTMPGLTNQGLELDTNECGPWCHAYHDRSNWDHLLAKIALRIQQVFQLSAILQTTADEVRTLLQCDRVLLYRFDPDWSGIVAAESIADPCWSLIDHVVRDSCFEAAWIQPYREGRYAAIADVANANLTPCYAEFLAKFQIRANLAIPILNGSELWGLIVVHQCQGPRRWNNLEIDGLLELAVQVGIAIQQATLIDELQTAKATLAAQVADQTAELARKNEELARLAAIVESSHDAILSITPEGIITSWNHASEELLGYTAQEAIGESFSIIVPPERRAESQQLVRQIAEKKKVSAIETQRQHKDGSVIDVSLTAFQVRDQSGNLIGNSGILRDIREQHKDKKRLEDQAAILRIFYDTSPLMMGIVEISDNDILHISSNSETLDFFGVTEAEMSCQWATKLGILDEYIQVWLEKYRLSQEEKQPICFEYEHCKPTQNYRLLATVRFIGIGDDDRPRFSYIVQDLSDRKRAEENLLKAEKIGQELKLLENVLDVIQAGYWDWDIANDQEYFSLGFKRMLGYEDDELPNTPHTWQMLIHKEDLPVILDRLEQHVRSQGNIPYTNEVRCHKKDGSMIWVNCSGQVIEWDQAGNPLRMIGCHLDITDRKQSELELQGLSQRLTLALNSGEIGTWDCNLVDEASWDDRMYKIYGFDHLDRPVVYQDWINVLHPDDVLASEIAFKHSVETGEDLSMEFRIYRATDGQLRWIKSVARVLVDDQNQAERIIGINYDITDQKQAEFDLKSARSQLELVLEASSEGYWDWNLMTNKIYFSSEWKAMLGYEDHELENTLQMWQSLIFEEDYIQAIQLIDDYNSGKIQSFEAEQRFHHKNGSTVYIMSRAIHLKDDQGQVIRMIGSHLNMTPVVEAQAALKSSEMQLSGVLNSSLDGIMAFRSVRNDEGKIIDFQWLMSNPMACELIERTSEELIGQNLLTEMIGNREEGLFQEYVRVVESGEPSQKEFYYNNNGIDSWFQNIAVKLEDGFAVTFRNVTAIKQSEKALKEANEALEARIQELKERNTEMVRLSEVSDFLQAALSTKEACMAISNLLEPLFPGCSGAVFLTCASRNRIEQAVTWGPQVCSQSDFVPHDCWGLRRGRVHTVGADRPSLRCNHVQADPAATTLCIPMIAQGETLGLFYLCSQRAQDLPESKQQLARTMSEQLALAIANLDLRETLHRQSIRDALTGLFNRRYLEEALHRELAQSQRNHYPVGIVMIDVDHFKKFNDTYGHEAGDHVLKAVSDLLRQSVRGSDIACRYGGEEMTLILPEASLESTAQRAEMMRAAIAQLQLRYNSQLLANITASFGVALFPCHGTTGAAVLQAADAALYRAKAAGRNCVVVAP